MNNFFLFFIFSISCLAAMNIDEKMNPADASSINPSNPFHRLMQHPTQEMPDYFKDIRTQLVTILLEDTDTLYPKALSALAHTNKAWAQTVREVTDKIFTSEGKKILSNYRPFLSIKKDLEISFKFIKQVKPINYSTLLLGFKRLFIDEVSTDVNAKDKDNKDCTALHFAACKGNTEIIKLLFSAGAYIDSKDANDWTPLHYAADCGHPEAVKLLLAASADKDSMGSGWTPLHLAGRADVVKLLLSAGADKDSKNSVGSTPLHDAVISGHAKVELLLDAGADKDSKDEYGSTPLHLAALCGRAEIVKLLLNAGAKIHITNDGGKTPLDLAIKREIKELLLAHNAKRAKPN